MALAASLCEAADRSEMTLFARARLDLLRQVVEPEHGAPNHDAFSRVFRMIAPEPFEAAFAAFMTAFGGARQGVVAIDGKASRGACTHGHRAIPANGCRLCAGADLDGRSGDARRPVAGHRA